MNGIAAYNATQGKGQADLVTEHTPLLKRIAYHMVGRLPASVQVDDLIQAGAIGLIEAARNFDATQGASFETYASIRIRGAMLDEIRKTDWIPRSLRKRMRDLSEAIRTIENRTGRPAQPDDIIKELGISQEEYNALLRDSANTSVLSLDEVLTDNPEQPHEETGSDDIDPLATLEDDDFRHALVEVIDQLPEREKLVMSLYYEQDLNLREIGQVLEVSESRVCQIHGQALARIRSKMTEWI